MPLLQRFVYPYHSLAGVSAGCHFSYVCYDAKPCELSEADALVCLVCVSVQKPNRMGPVVKQELPGGKQDKSSDGKLKFFIVQSCILKLV